MIAGVPVCWRLAVFRRWRGLAGREVLAVMLDGILAFGWRGVGRVPACQSSKIASRRAKMRAKMAAIMVCRAADSLPRSAPEGAVPALRRLAI